MANETNLRHPSGFELRAPFGAWRWVILAAIGVGARGCGGDASGGGTGASACAPAGAWEGGFESCTSGLVHRATVGACSSPPPEPLNLIGEEFRVCRTDDECSDSELCFCGPDGGLCVPAACRADADCGTGNLCANNIACGVTRFHCQTPSDECSFAADCLGGEECQLVDFGELNPLASPAGLYRACRPIPIGCPFPGRPFLIAGAARSAGHVERRDWFSSVDAAPAASMLASELRAELAHGWLEQALMEHASVAAFARFVLQLLSLGAPPDLVADAAAAMQDEIRHAQDCFRLARRHASRELGPGPLPMGGALEASDLTAVVLGTVREGCIGETLAALEAAEALRHCEDEIVRPVLERIAAEETRHAELAWRFVAWALRTTLGSVDSTDLRRQVREAFAAELGAAAAAQPISSLDRELARHGLLGASVRQALRTRALREVIAPGAAALLELVVRNEREPSHTPGARCDQRGRGEHLGRYRGAPDVPRFSPAPGKPCAPPSSGSDSASALTS